MTTGTRLFALSFVALFLELMIIRWAPSVVRLVAYYANLMLVSSFLGLGVGSMVSPRGLRLFRLLAPAIAFNVLVLLVLARLPLPGVDGEWRYFQVSERSLLSYLTLTLIFVVNALAFVPLGDEIGRQFQRLPPLRAYSWDLAGSLAGTLVFGGFSLMHFSPILGLALVILMGLGLGTARDRIRALPFYALALGALIVAGDGDAYWSPYYFITVGQQSVEVLPAADVNGQTVNLIEAPARTPPPNLRTMQDPPIYVVHVNRDFYQLHGSVDVGRYSSDSWESDFARSEFAQYRVPYQLAGNVDRVLVLGAGGGMDVQAALMQGASRVDAVEIDPVIPRLSTKYSAAAPYDRPEFRNRVVLHIDDARAFLQSGTDLYDMVIFGFLDSQALFSYGSSLRLDGYTYTVESFRRAFARVRSGGSMSVSFAAGQPWLVPKLVQMLERGTGKRPSVYARRAGVVMTVTKGEPPTLPTEILWWRHIEVSDLPADLATDDWPYLYLHSKSIPRDYVVVIGLLLAVSVLAVVGLRGRNFGTPDAHFFFMGWGFLLLQTKSIGDCSLYFGTTWLVTTVVVAGVLLMVLLANWASIAAVKTFTPWLYVPLFAALALVLLVPRDLILGQRHAVRLAWTLFAVPLPIFFAGLIFSATFRDSTNPSALLGSNLLGATIGGFCEYLAMWSGSQALGYIVVAVYLASLACIFAARRRAGASLPFRCLADG